jgi:hypothetical protein
MNVEGNWQLNVDSPMGKQQLTVDLHEEDGTLTGILTNNGNNMTTDIFDGSVHGDELQWKVKLQQIKVTLTFDTTVQGDTMTGKVKAGIFGKFSVSGKRAD